MEQPFLEGTSTSSTCTIKAVECWHVDQAILNEEERVVVIRFGHDWDPTCMRMDEVLYAIAEKVKNFAVLYLVDITEVPDFNKMYELYDPCTI
ncbi:Thioredoxin-like 4A, partial [Quaeritorhiza haematococci]